MKHILFIAFILINTSLFCQIPSVEIKNLNGKIINTSQFNNNNNPIIISFWATWCKPCKQELENIHEVYEDWQEETNVKLIAISIDDSRNSAKIKPMVDAKGWEYEVYQDSNREFASKMGVNPIPHTFLLDGNKNIVYEHVTYSDGDEEKLYEKLLQTITK
ncbi:MAG: thiol:disulfide interchange protein [Flavobacteriales bacterium]|nr:thiol:disulfide interchange protein [Flavobacteriales bacterium]|tara:strand:- start:71 stop:553 length:483 start_codon:yes stop_codon:yes gene_type:complete